MRNAPLNFKYKPHKTRFTRRSARLADKSEQAALNDPTVTSHKSDSYIESNIDTAHGKGRSSILTVDRAGLGQSGGPGETSYVGTYKDMLGGDKNLKKVVDKDYDHRAVSRSESDFKKGGGFSDEASYLYIGKTRGDNAGDQRLRGIGTIRGKEYVQSHGARHDVIQQRNLGIKRETEGMTPAEKRAYIKDAQNQFMAGIGRDDRIDPNLLQNYMKEEKRIKSDHKRFEGEIGADKLRLNNVYNNK